MDIVVEVGTEKARKSIEIELGLLAEASRETPLIFPLCAVIVPQDFDATVNKLEEREDFQSPQGGAPVSRIIYTKNGYVILFHAQLYTRYYDTHMRLASYWHAFRSLMNRGRFPVLHNNHRPDAFASYFMNMYALYGEFDATRRSFEFRDAVIKHVLKERLSAKAQQELTASLARNISTLTDRKNYYDWFTFQNSEYKKHGNSMIYLQNVRQKVTELSFSLIFAYATMDHYPDMRDQEEKLGTAPMLNNKTRDFLEFFRSVYDKDGTDLLAGVPLMEALWTNYGFRLYEENGHTQCEVLDI